MVEQAKTERSPREIVAELDRHVIGQNEAKRAVAIALRNRWRRQNVPEEIRGEIYPRNILMVGPTGVGKTEIARRLSKLVKAPFIKVEATKFTEVGYVGRDVDSIIRDLVDIAINMFREEARKKVEEQAKLATQARIINALVGEGASEDTKAKFLEKYLAGKLDDKEVEVSLQESQTGANQMPMFDVPGGQMGVFNLGDMLSKAMGGAKTKQVKLNVKDAYNAILKEEGDRLLDQDRIVHDALEAVQQDGIVFLDEIDKICSRSESHGKGEVSREGVQRDLLPLIEGTTVATKHGPVKTDHILFIGSGAFHLAKPSDLLPELQGRLPIRVELKPLSQDDFVRILKEPAASLLKQYKELFNVEKVTLEFKDDGIAEIAKLATELNKEIENIGARRLYTIMEKLLEEVNFTADEMPNETVTIDKAFVDKHLGDLVSKHDLAKFVL
jgi:ATP-dependent HslUV protease ATP-binding subunit HslU